MNEKNKIAEIKTKLVENLNHLARNAQAKTMAIVLGAVAVLVFTGWVFMHSENKEVTNNKSNKELVQLDGTTDSQFTEASAQKALEEQQREIKDLNEKLTEVTSQMGDLQKSLDERNQEELNDNKVALQDLQLKIAELETTLKRSGQIYGSSPMNNSEDGVTPRGITTTNFSYGEQALGASDIKTVKDYVPPGTFARAILLSGADTNAGVQGQTDTTPITMKILDNGTLPNGEHSSLKGCFVTAAAYGDASSERGQIRLQRLSCVRPNSHVLDIPVEGTINDMGGSDGMRGHVVMRNNKLIWNAGVSGMLSGIGHAMQQSTTTQSVLPLGVTSAIKSGKIFEHGASSGANTALGKLADYYIKLADMYHPIVQIHAGAKVNIVFLKGFSLTEGHSLAESKPEISGNVQETIAPGISEDTKSSQIS